MRLSLVIKPGHVTLGFGFSCITAFVMGAYLLPPSPPHQSLFPYSFTASTYSALSSHNHHVAARIHHPLRDRLWPWHPSPRPSLRVRTVRLHDATILILSQPSSHSLLCRISYLSLFPPSSPLTNEAFISRHSCAISPSKSLAAEQGLGTSPSTVCSQVLTSHSYGRLVRCDIPAPRSSSSRL